MNVLKNIADEKYKNKLTYPDRPKEDRRLNMRATLLSDQDIAALPALKATFEQEMENYRKARERYRQEDNRLCNQFRADLEVEFNMVGHRKADKLWELALEEGQGSGYSEVYRYYMMFVELVE